MIQEITVVGGTHGNEYIGITIIDRINRLGTYQDNAIPVSTLLANPRAAASGIRFIDTDLNRSFSDSILADTDSRCYEHLRARDINRQLGPEPDFRRFIIDLHSTTSNMGMTIILKDLSLSNLRVATFAQSQHPGLRLILSNTDLKFNRTMGSISQYGLTIEVGPIANALVRQDLLLQTEAVVDSIIECLNLSESSLLSTLPDQVELYKVLERVQYPLDTRGRRVATVHEKLQDQDFRQLQPGAPAFYGFDGQSLGHQGSAGYPIFINEAAYYRENTAYVITEKITHPLSQAPSP